VASKPMFDFRLEGRAISRFSPRENPATLLEWLRQEGWRGKLTIDLPGNGGISTIQFEEVRKLTPSD
jgi:hypothetical protein